MGGQLASLLLMNRWGTLMYGASALRATPTTGPPAPQGQSVARREAPLSVRPGAAKVAASMVLADIKQEEPPDPVEELEDMPELEATPPPPFPSRASQETLQRGRLMTVHGLSLTPQLCCSRFILTARRRNFHKKGICRLLPVFHFNHREGRNCIQKGICRLPSLFFFEFQ